ncbi:MAG: flavin monoamine oxidase family protein [Rubrobacteraceae bacterium]
MRRLERLDTESDIVVIGAGLSGLTAARELALVGQEVLVLEARDRPGGRTQVAEIEGVTVDLGGEWVDEAHAEIRKLVGDLGLNLYPFERRKEDARWHVGGKTTNEMPFSRRDAEVYHKMNEALVEAASATDPETYWRDAPRDDVSVEGWLRNAGMSEGGIHVVETLTSSCGSTVPLARMSFYSYAVKVATRGGPGKGNEYRVEGGAGSVALALAAELEGRVSYSSPVTEVRQSDSGVEVSWMDGDGPRLARARRVILAVPFTCYRGIRFGPEPPPVFRRMISGSVYGVVRKMALVFDAEVDASKFTVTDTPLGYCSVAQDPGSTKGSRGIISFAGGSPLLTELGLPEEVRKRRAVELLRGLYDVPEPVAVIEKVWANDYWTGGSYMIMSPGDARAFGEVMGGSFGRVHLAGAEGFAAAPSFMNSAVKSGLRAGREVAEALEIGAPGLTRAGTER